MAALLRSLIAQTGTRGLVAKTFAISKHRPVFVRWATYISDPTHSSSHILAAYKVDVDKLAKQLPAYTDYDMSNVRAVMEFLDSHEIDCQKVIARRPRILRSTPVMLASNFEYLQTLPIDATKAIESCPALLTTPVPTLQSKVLTLVSLGLYPALILRRYPTIVHRSDETLRKYMHFLNDVGLDAVRLFNLQPGLISGDIERKLRLIVEFVTKDMGRPLEEINRCPRCLTCSLDKRLRPRYRYTMLYGRRTDYSLSALFVHTDERFARTIAGQTVEHYREWMASVVF